MKEMCGEWPVLERETLRTVEVKGQREAIWAT